MLGLKWEDLNLEAGTLRVRRTLTRAGGKHTLSEPKTKKSRRTVRLTTGAVTVLREHLNRQMEEMNRLSSLYRPGGLVFAVETGGIINPSNLRCRSFARLLKRAGLPSNTRSHDLRHTCATLLLSRNVNPKRVSEMLGHANIAITLDTYSHVFRARRAKRHNGQDAMARETCLPASREIGLLHTSNLRRDSGYRNTAFCR